MSTKRDCGFDSAESYFDYSEETKSDVGREVLNHEKEGENGVVQMLRSRGYMNPF